jgi:parallel beta-helix repeat protein
MLTMLSIGILTLAFNVPLVEPRVDYDRSAVFASSSSEVEIYYDNNANNPGGLGGSLPGGLAVNFTPPCEEYWALKRVKFYGMRWANESYGNMTFYVEVWDRDGNELLHIAYKYSDYFKNYDSKWVTVDIPDVLVKDDFFVCVFPNMIYMPSGLSPHMNVGFNNDLPISNRSYRVRMDDNSINWQIPGNLFIRAIMSEPIITVPDDFPTIQEAINAANEGDTVYVRAGTYYENVVVNKSISLIGENPNNTIIDGGETGNVVYLGASDINISGFTIRNSGTSDWDTGVCVSRSSGNNISFNIVTNNRNGIFIHESSKNTLTNNVVTANRVYGVHLWDTSNDTLTDNTVSNNFDGIIIELCSNTILRNNTASGNMYNFGVGGVELSHFVHDIDTSNKVEGKSIQYLVDRKDMVIDSSWDVGHLYLVNSTNVTVKDLTLTIGNWHGIQFAYTRNSRIENVTISKTSYAIDFSYSSNNTIINSNISNRMGIRLDGSSGNSIINNSISNTWHAVSFFYSSNNTITNNYISNNRYGIWSYDSSYNKIYHNNFVENTQHIYDSSIECPEYPLSINIWDDGYPSGGNYWGDYAGVDEYSGSYQNETGGDGIGDTPYIIDENNQDNYPLMNPYRSDTEEMRILYYDLLEKYNELSSRHHELLDIYSKLLWDFGALNATHYGLLADYDNLQTAHDSLNSTYNNLVSDYNNLQLSYDQLNSSYTTLQDSYDKLQLDQEAMMNELSTVRTLMYILVAATIILVAATVHFAKRKLPPSPE